MKGPNAVWWLRKPFYYESGVGSQEPTKIVTEGDSIAFATFGLSYLWRRAPQNVNLAVPGSTIADMAARSAACDAERIPGAVLIVWCGTNTLAGEPDTIAGGDDAANQLFTYLDNRAAAGWLGPQNKMLFLNVARRGNSPPGYPQTARTQCNLRFANEGHLHSSQAVLDVTGLPGTPGDDRYYDVDAVHILQPGYSWLYRNVYAPVMYELRI